VRRERSAALTGPALSLAALIGAGVLAIIRPSVGHTIAAALGAVLLVVSVLMVRLGRRVSGRRALPRWYAAAAVAAVLVTLLVRGAVSGWTAGWTAAAAVGLALAPTALLAAVEVPLWRALRIGEAAGVTVIDTHALRPVTRLALDGIATLVDGKVVSGVNPVEESHLRNLRWFAGALAHAADTPIGHAVAALAGRGNVTEAVALDDEISGSVDRHPVRLSLTAGAAGALALGGPWDVVSVEVDGRALGTLTISDALRLHATDDITRLSSAGIATTLVAPAEDARATAIAEGAGCPLSGTAPSDTAAVLTSHPEGALDVAGPDALRIGPHSQHLRLAEASIGHATAALELCRAVVAATRRGVLLALILAAAGTVLAAIGLLAPWAAATFSLAAAIAVGTVASIAVSSEATA